MGEEPWPYSVLDMPDLPAVFSSYGNTVGDLLFPTASQFISSFRANLVNLEVLQTTYIFMQSILIIRANTNALAEK